MFCMSDFIFVVLRVVVVCPLMHRNTPIRSSDAFMFFDFMTDFPAIINNLVQVAVKYASINNISK